MELTESDFKNFPSTRYQGSKRKILPWIYNTLKDLPFNSVLDVCGGSASVSYMFKKMGKHVTYNDKLHFNYVIGKALIENNSYKLTEEDINNLNEVNPKINYSDFISTNFKGVYYLDEENEWLDKVTNNIIRMNHYQPVVLEYKRALAFYSIFQASLIKRPFNLFHRKNLQIRTNDVPRKFGNKVTWEKTFDEYLIKFSNEANQLVFDSGINCYSKNESLFDIDEYGYDLVYIDIPYIRKDSPNESSNYLRCYHFLEGLSKYDQWPNLIDYNTINLRLKNIEEQNDFTTSNIYERVEEIISKFKRSIIVFSYKKGGLPSIEYIIKVMKRFKPKVYTCSMHYKYALNHQNGNAKKNREVLIIGV